MFPSKVPVLYVLQLCIIAALLITGMIVGGLVLREPLSLLLVLGLFFMPEYPLVPENEAAEEEEDLDKAMQLYEGEHSNKQQLGFMSEPNQSPTKSPVSKRYTGCTCDRSTK